MSSFKNHFTRDRANKGIKMPLKLPDGALSDDFLVIRGIDSDEFRHAEAELKRKAIEQAVDPNKERPESEQYQERVFLLSSLIADWSFDEKFTPENVEEFLREAPHIGDEIDRTVMKRSLFFGSKSNASPSTQKPSSN